MCGLVLMCFPEGEFNGLFGFGRIWGFALYFGVYVCVIKLLFILAGSKLAPSFIL